MTARRPAVVVPDADQLPEHAHTLTAGEVARRQLDDQPRRLSRPERRGVRRPLLVLLAWLVLFLVLPEATGQLWQELVVQQLRALAAGA